MWCLGLNVAPDSCGGDRCLPGSTAESWDLQEARSPGLCSWGLMSWLVITTMNLSQEQVRPFLLSVSPAATGWYGERTLVHPMPAMEHGLAASRNMRPVCVYRSLGLRYMCDSSRKQAESEGGGELGLSRTASTGELTQVASSWMPLFMVSQRE
jgi:hypothetical protein